MAGHEKAAGEGVPAAASDNNSRDHYSPHDAIGQFKTAMLSAGLQPPESIEPGKLHRFPGIGKGRGNKDAYCKMFPDMEGGVFGDWSTGLKENWQTERTKPCTAEERGAFRRSCEAEHKARESEQRQRHEAAAIKTAGILAKADGDPAQHPYALKKAVPFGPLVKRGAWAQRGWADTLLIPLHDAEGKLWTLEAINVDGEKDFLKGGKKAGCFHPFGQIRGASRVLIGEGFATVAAVHSGQTGSPAVAAMDAGNLKAVALAVRKLAPNAEIILLADNDVKANGTNPGLRAAKEAAQAVNGRVAIPELDGRKCDFWDLWKERGVDAVRAALGDSARIPEPEAATTREASATRANPGESPPLSVYDLDLSIGEGRNHFMGVVGEAPRDAAEYPEPQPLPELPPVPPFDVDLLPDDLRGYVEDCANRARFPTDFAAVAATAALGSLVGRKLGIRLKQRDDWTEYGNLWGVLVGPPSSLKSPAMRDAMRPFKVLQAAADEAQKAALQLYVGEIDSFKLRKEAKKKLAGKALSKDINAEIDVGCGTEPEAPVARTYWTSDATAEKLGVLLAENENGLLVERDELASLLSTLDDEKHAAARGLYLSGWSGKEGYRFDRIMRGTTFLPKFAISIIGGIQPGPLTRYVRQAFTGERADGLLQRFQLAVWPDPEGFEYVDRYLNRIAKQAASDLFKRVDAFNGGSIGIKDKFGDDPPYIHLSPAAQEIFIEWYTAFMRERRAVESGNGETSPLAAHFGKYPGLVGKLTLIIHVADDPDSSAVSDKTLLKALAWLQYLAPHAQRIYHATDNPETGAASLLLARLKRGDLPEKFNARDIYRKCWHGLTDRAAVKGSCDLLLGYGWLIQTNPAERSFGRPSDPIYSVSPAVRGK